MILDIVIYIFTGLGVLFFLGTSLGLVRFPDFYTRMHAAGKGDTLSSVMILIGIAGYAVHHHFDLPSVLVVLKILLIGFFIFMSSPTATHALMDAGYRTGVSHWKKGKKDT